MSTNLYFKELLYVLNETSNLSIASKNNFWRDKYLGYLEDIKVNNINTLPQIITLIYPDFLIDNTGKEIGHLINHNRSNFSEAITDSDICQISLIDNDCVCEFNNYRNLRKKCHADHYWPFSLGGPTILENRILLCKFHNVAKSNSIMNQFWLEYPNWLNGYLNRMYNLKQ